MTTRKERAYEHIRRGILDGSLRPGDRLSNRKLADAIGISLIPVREATAQLASEGLVEHRPGVGSFVASCSREELAELYDLREALECHAAAQAAQRIGTDELAVMSRCNQRLLAIAEELDRTKRTQWPSDRIRRWLQADVELHLTVFRAAGNRRALEVVRGLRIMTRIFAQRWTAPPVGDSFRGCADHVALIEALQTQDRSRAREVTRRHIQRACADSLAAYDQRRLAEVTVPGELADLGRSSEKD